MIRTVITGVSGFVAGHFIEYLYDNSIECEILGIDRSAPKFDLSSYCDRIKMHFSFIDLMDREALKNAIKDFKPEYVLHLAAFSSVAPS